MSSLYAQRCYGCYFIPLLKSDLSIKIHGVVSLPDARRHITLPLIRLNVISLSYWNTSAVFLLLPLFCVGFLGTGG